MAHKIQVILAKEKIIEKFCKNWVHAQKLILPQGFALIPLKINLLKDINELNKNNNIKPYKEFIHLSSSLQELLIAESVCCKIAYLETEYIGGNGKQSAILYSNKEIIGPFSTVTEWNDKKLEIKDKPEGERAINKILYKMQVSSKYRDEFSALGLDYLISNNKIITKINEKKEKQTL